MRSWFGWLLGLTALAAALRIPGLNSGLWFDEVVTLVESARPPLGELLGTYAGENNHPLYSLLANLCVSTLGESAWTLRLPAFVFGVLCVPALFWFAVRVTGPGEALLASAFLTVSYHHVWFSQNARGYTMLLFFTLMGTRLLLDGLDRRGRRCWIGYGVVMALALYTHLTAVFVLAGHGAVVLVQAFGSGRSVWQQLRRAVPGFVVTGAGALLLYAPILPQVVGAFLRRFRAADAPEEQDFATVKVEAWTDPFWAFLAMVEQVGPVFLAAAAAGGLILFVGLLSYWKSERRLPVTFVVPSVLGVVVLLALQRHFYPRFFFFEAGFGLLLLVRGLDRIAGFVVARRVSGDRPATAGVGLCVVALIASLVLLPRNYRWPKQDFAGARDHVESVRGAGSQVVTAGLARVPYQLLYAPEWVGIEDPEELSAAAGDTEELWLVYYDRTYMESVHPGLLRRIDADFETVREFPGTVGGGTLFVCRAH